MPNLISEFFNFNTCIIICIRSASLQKFILHMQIKAIETRNSASLNHLIK